MKLGVTILKGQSYSKEASVILLGKELFSKKKSYYKIWNEGYFQR